MSSGFDGSAGYSRWSFSSGNSGVRESNGTRSFASCGLSPLTVITLVIAMKRSLSRGLLTCPNTVSPVLRPQALIMLWET